jgi:hypothetical protein
MNLSKIEKSHDAVEIALLACESLGTVMGEDSFYDRQKNKLEVARMRVKIMSEHEGMPTQD